MFPRLLELGPLTVYSYGVLLRPPACWRCTSRSAGPAPWGSTATASSTWDLHHHLGPGRREAAPAHRRLRLSAGSRRSCGRWPGRAASSTAGSCWRSWSASGTSASTACRCGRSADAIAPGIALGHVVGRFGCLLAGCCYGKPTTLPWGMTFTDTFAASNVGTPLHVALHPTQLYDGGTELADPRVPAAHREWWRKRAGWTFWVYILLYGISRFVDRDVPRRPARHDDGVLDVAVHLDHPGPAGAGDADRALAWPAAPADAAEAPRAAPPSGSARTAARDGMERVRTHRRRRTGRAAARPLPGRAGAGPVALADPAAHQGRAVLVGGRARSRTT